MKKIWISLVILSVSLSAEVVSIVPYIGFITYDTSIEKSLKNSSTLGGVYANVGTLSYLLEFNYASMNTEYKSSVTDINLEQDDFTLAYSQYSTNLMYKLGVHYTSTNDIVLGNALVGIVSIGGYHFKGYDKYSYGVDAYYSLYLNGRNENQDINATSELVGVAQLSPYFSWFNSISYTQSNLIGLRLNYQIANSYVQKTYLSYELSETFYYKNWIYLLELYNGEMRSGVKSGGMSVFNSLDLQKYGVKAQISYYFTAALVGNVSYSLNSYQEYSLTQDTYNGIGVATVNYRF